MTQRRYRGIYRGVVIESYVRDEDDNVSGFAVECVVMLIAYQLPVIAVVRQNNHGVNNLHGLWVPKGSTRSTQENETLNQKTRDGNGNYIGPGTPPQNLDGDEVIVEFMDGDWGYPIVTGAYSHRQTKRYVHTGPGWQEGDPSTRGTAQKAEAYTSHQGTEIRINEAGDYLIDTVGANSDPVDEDPETGAGQIRLRLKATQRFTVEMDGIDVLEVYQDDDGVHVDLGEGAEQQIVMGNRMAAWAGNHIHPTAVGLTGIPVPTAGGETITLPDQATFLSTQHSVADNEP